MTAAPNFPFYTKNIMYPEVVLSFKGLINYLQVAQSILRSYQVLGLSRISPHFMEPGGS